MKALNIAFKDTLTTFRDRNALLLMIAAPMVIAVIMGFAFGGQSGASSPIFEIPLVVVNADLGSAGANITDILQEIEVDTAEGAKGLFSITELMDKEAAIKRVENGEVRGVVYIPPQFSSALENVEPDAQAVTIEVYTDPTANVSPGIIRSVVRQITTGYNTIIIGNQVVLDQVLDPLTDIPAIIVNSDTGPVSAALNETFNQDNWEGLLTLTWMDNLVEAQALLSDGKAAVILHITDRFSQVVISGGTSAQVEETLEIFTAEGEYSAPFVRDLFSKVIAGFGSDSLGEPSIPVVFTNLDELDALLLAENTSFSETEGSRTRVRFDTQIVGTAEDFNLLNYFVPSMAIFFLMFAVFDGTRSILEEERDGTLHRLMTTPTGRVEVLLGKIGGTFFTGILQFVVLVVVSGLVFGVDWGKAPLGIALMVLATVAAATSLGAFVASFARNVNQAGVLGTAVTLIFGILGGNFIDYRSFPPWLSTLSKATINRWALDGFVNLTFGGLGLQDVLLNIGVLFGIAGVFFTLAVSLFNRRFVS